MFYVYNNLPGCMLSLDIVEDLIWERFQLYMSKNLQDDTDQTCDAVAHIFMIVIALDYPLFNSVFMRGEVKIFKQKLAKGKHKLKDQLQNVLQYLEVLKQSKEFGKLVQSNELNLIISIIETIINKSRHVFKEGHSKKCRKFKLILPFTFLLNLVARRKVLLKDGKIHLSCGDWDEVLVRIAQFLLQLELKMVAHDGNLRESIYNMEDDRIRQIIVRFVNFLTVNLSKVKQTLKAEEVDGKSKYFPPCMANLHQILRQTHRLSYNSRYQYTLFLKDIGLSVEENIQFWENEYNKPHAGSSCTHEWEEKHKRYKYQIQHLYGMIGTHGPKTSHGCEKFIESLEVKMDGGCPFQHYTEEELKEALPRNMLSVPDVEEIFKFKCNGLAQKACGVYLKCQQKILMRKRQNFENLTSRGFYILSPLQYYNIANAM